MRRDIVVGIDSSTTSTKAIAWDERGTPLVEGRHPIELDSPHASYYEQNAEDWWASTVQALRRLTRQIDPARIAAIAISNQRETFVPLDVNGQALRPGIVWLDERCRAEVAWLAELVGEERIHRISGKPLDLTPVVYRITWLVRFEPEIVERGNDTYISAGR